MAVLSEEQVELWILMLKEVPFSSGTKRMKNHILTNKFPPTIADIASSEQPIDHERLKSETAAQLADMDRADQLAIDCPPHRIPRFLKDGVSE